MRPGRFKGIPLGHRVKILPLISFAVAGQASDGPGGEVEQIPIQIGPLVAGASKDQGTPTIGEPDGSAHIDL
jgi:hypothetical protein